MSIQSPDDSVENTGDYLPSRPSANVYFANGIQPDGDSSASTNNGSAYDGEEDESKPLLSTNSCRWAVESGHLQFEDKDRRKKRWRSIYMMYFTMFLTSLTFSLVISSIWPYLLQVDYHNATPTFLGWVVASFSIGMLVSAPLFGLWADYRPSREPLITSMVINILFNLLYAYCGAFPSGIAGWIMMVARFVIGVAAGVGSVSRSYVAESTDTKERIGAMAAIGSCQALGFVLGPVMGLAFVPLGSHGISIHAIRLQLNMYTGPGYIGVILGIINFIVITFFFKEYKLEDKETKKKRLEEEARKKKEEKLRKQKMKESRLLGFSEDAPMKHYDRFGAAAAVIVFFVVMSGFSVFETLLAPLTMDEFGWTQKQTVLYNNLFYACLSIITISTLNGVRYSNKIFDPRVVMMVGLFLGAFGFFVLIPMSNEPPELITIATVLNPLPPQNSSHAPMILLVNSNETAPAQGCREPPLMWCSHVPRIYLPQLIVSLIICTFSYAMATVTCFSIFSRILGPFPQGIMMGVLTAMGSLARGLGPMTMGLLYQHYGPLVTFTTMVGLYMVTIVFAVLSFPRLVPYERYAGQAGFPR